MESMYDIIIGIKEFKKYIYHFKLTVYTAVTIIDSFVLICRQRPVCSFEPI